jgi:hypothetical protein
MRFRGWCHRYDEVIWWLVCALVVVLLSMVPR